MNSYVSEVIAKEGWILSIDKDDNNIFSIYTTGLFESYNHPELIMIGLHVEEMRLFFIEIIENYVKKGIQLDLLKNYYNLGEYFSFSQTVMSQVLLIPVDQRNIIKSLPLSYTYYHSDISAIQIVWADFRGIYPFEYPRAKNSFRELQPMLGNVSILDYKIKNCSSIGINREFKKFLDKRRSV